MISVICLHTVNWLKALLFNTNNSIQQYSFICTPINGFKYCNVILIILFNITNSFTVKWLQVLSCITNNSIKHQSFVYTQLNDQTVLYLTIQFSISHLFAHSLNNKTSSIWPIDRTPSDATTPGGSEPGSNSNEEILYIPQSSRIWASPSDCLVSYSGHFLGEDEGGSCLWCILSALADWATL